MGQKRRSVGEMTSEGLEMKKRTGNEEERTRKGTR